MFVWTSGMHPGFALVFFVVGLVFVLYSFASAFRWTRGWDRIDQLPGHRPRHDDANRATEGWKCPHDTCRTLNPPHARYCRMCGRQRVQ